MADLSELSLLIIVMLLCVSVIAAYLDVLVGGGGLLTISALLLAGVPTIDALGTNKLQAAAGSGTAAIKLLCGKYIRFKNIRYWMLASFLGALLATILVQGINPNAFKYVIPFVIVCISFYFLLANRTVMKAKQRLSKRIYGVTIVPLIGFYDGFFGPATGSFFVMAAGGLLGTPIKKATMTAKALNFASNFGSLLVFAYFGKIYWAIGLLMLCGQVIGAYLGTQLLLTVNPQILRRCLVLMSLIILAAWLYKEMF